MRKIFFLLLLTVLPAAAQQHCGYDFTSFIVLHVHEEGKKENIANLRITLIDSTGTDAVNRNNRYSWRNKDEVLLFSKNFQIDSAGNKLEKPDATSRWNFPYAKDVWLLSVTNEFPADEMMVRITDPSGTYETQDVQLYAFNMYILCTSQAEQGVQFGRKMNKPIDVILRRK